MWHVNLLKKWPQINLIVEKYWYGYKVHNILSIDFELGGLDFTTLSIISLDAKKDDNQCFFKLFMMW